MTLGEYLQASTRKRWQPGVFDCCFFPIEWAVSWGLGDPGAKWRGRYRTDLGGQRFIKRAGGLVQLWDEGLSSIGVGRVDEPQAGDVGVVLSLTSPDAASPVGAIFSGTKWAFAIERGILLAPAEPIGVWGVRHG